MSLIKIIQVSATNKKKDGGEMPNNTLKVGLKTTNKAGEEVWLNGIVEKEAISACSQNPPTSIALHEST